MIGAGPIGRQVTSRFETAGKDVCLVDLSPINLHGFAQEGFRTVAGDATDRTTFELARVDRRVPRLSFACRTTTRPGASYGVCGRPIPSCFVLVRCRYQAIASKLRNRRRPSGQRGSGSEPRIVNLLAGLDNDTSSGKR